MTATSDNTQRFTGRVEDYERYRQRYPAQPILDLLRTWCGLSPAWLIADIGAGTGMLADIFLENENRVLAIEPNADMRAACERLRIASPQLEVRDATAEATTLAAHSIDLVAAGRAFHWFNKELALAEFRRILKPHGWVALVSLGRAHSTTDVDLTQQTAAFEQLLIHHGTDYKYIRSSYRVHEGLAPLFGAHAEFHQTQIDGTQQLDWAAFRGHTMSLSVVPQPGHPAYDRFQRELRSFFETHARAGVLTIPTTCWVTAARFGTE